MNIPGLGNFDFAQVAESLFHPSYPPRRPEPVAAQSLARPVVLPSFTPPLTHSITARSTPSRGENMLKVAAALVGGVGVSALGAGLVNYARSSRSPVSLVLGALFVAAVVAGCANGIGDSYPLETSDAGTTDVVTPRRQETSPTNLTCGRVDQSIYEAQARRVNRQSQIASSNHPDAAPDSLSDASVASLSSNVLAFRHSNTETIFADIAAQNAGQIVTILDSGEDPRNQSSPYRAGRVAIITENGAVFCYSHEGQGRPLQALPASGIPIEGHPNVAFHLSQSSTVRAAAFASEMGQSDGDGGIRFGLDQSLFTSLHGINANSIFISYRRQGAGGGVDNNSYAPIVIMNLGEGAETPSIPYTDACETISRPVQRPHDAGSDADVVDASDAVAND